MSFPLPNENQLVNLQRMENQSPSLGDQIARLRHTAQARENCAWCPAAVHALIAAIFARIFGRLERVLLLWQAGTLPTAPARRAAEPDRAGAPRTPLPCTSIVKPAARHARVGHRRAALRIQPAAACRHSPVPSTCVAPSAHPRPSSPSRRRLRALPARPPPPGRCRTCRENPASCAASARFFHYDFKTID